MRSSHHTGRPNRIGAAVGRVALLAAAAAAVVSVDPARLGLSTTPVVLHALSFRGPTGLLLTGSGAAALARRRIRPAAGRDRLLGSVGATLLACGAAHLVIQARRGWSGPSDQGRADLVVITANTLAGAAAPRQVAALVDAELDSADAAVVALPETSADQARRCADLLATAGHRFQVFSASEGPRDSDSTSLLISEQLGRYRQVPAPRLLLGAVLAQPVDGPGTTFAAVHPGAPVPAVGYPEWVGDVRTAVQLCRAHPDSVVAGDFNTTIDHAMLRELAPVVDAAVVAGRGAEGTWPAHFPAPLAAPIDHILINGGHRVLGTRTVRVGASDHRAVIARLRLLR